MINIQRQWKQANNSDLYGNISVTKNINFDKEGYLQLSNSPRSVIDETTADFDNPASILFSEDYGYFVPTWDSAFSASTSILLTKPIKIVTAGVPSTDIQTDTIWANGLMVVSQDTDVDYYNPATDTWTDTNITLTSDGQHPMVNFLSLNAIAVTDVNTIKLYSLPLSATPTLITTLTIPSTFEITSIAYLNQNLYIGTQHQYGGHAFLYVWNGQGSAAQQAYEVDSNTIFSVVANGNTVYATTGNGSLLRFNGGGFDLADAFPIFYTDQSITGEGNFSMYKNTMKSNGDVIYILFSNRGNDDKRLLNQPDGVWCYDKNVGLYHKYSLSNSLVNIQAINTTAVDITTNQITVASPAFSTGTEVYYNNDGSTTLAGLINNQKYFVIKVDATHIKLATTKALSITGTAVDLTGTGNSNQKLVFFPNIDFGQSFTEKTTAMEVIERPVISAQYGTDLLWGAEVNRRDNTGGYGTLGTVSDGVEARGYFITPKVFSQNVTETFNLLTVKFSPFTSELDKIIIKYRTEDDMKQYINLSEWGATWTSTTTFTTTQTDWSGAVVGDEIEVLRGAAGGLLAHITEITNNAGTYTVTIDETFDQFLANDLAVIIYRNWKKFSIIDSTNTLGYLSEQLGAINVKFIQLKIELRGLGVKIEEVKIDDKYLLPASN